jgi:hypothetical protein
MEANIVDADNISAEVALLITLHLYRVKKLLNLTTGLVVELEDALKKEVKHVERASIKVLFSAL